MLAGLRRHVHQIWQNMSFIVLHCFGVANTVAPASLACHALVAPFHSPLQKCGMLASAGWCQYCGSSGNIQVVRMPYACKLLLQELMSMNIVAHMKLSEC